MEKKEKDLWGVLDLYGLKAPLAVRQVEKKRVWEIGGEYFLKKSDREEKDIEKILAINGFLKSEGVLAPEYVKTASGAPYVSIGGEIYSLTRKISGEHISFSDPFAGEYMKTGRSIGAEMAKLHKALKKMGNEAVYESDLMGEFKAQLSEIKKENFAIPREIIDCCRKFGDEFRQLPKQLIHRDIQFENMLFENGELKCFLDFDSSQVNARLFDLAYFGQSVLFGGDCGSGFSSKWAEFFGSLLCGYNSENMLCENEMESMHMLCVIMQFSFISYYLRSEEKRGLAPRRLDMMKWMHANEFCFRAAQA